MGSNMMTERRTDNRLDDRMYSSRLPYDRKDDGVEDDDGGGQIVKGFAGLDDVTEVPKPLPGPPNGPQICHEIRPKGGTGSGCWCF